MKGMRLITSAGLALLVGLVATPRASTSDSSLTSATLIGTIDLQGRSEPPGPLWVVSVQATLTPAANGGPAINCTALTDENGIFSCAGVRPDSYAICVKAFRTLRTCALVRLEAGVNEVDFGTLKEGDANEDNCVALIDFSILATSFGRCRGDLGFDPRADFDGGGCITIIDFSLLATNFATCGDTGPAPQPPQAGRWGVLRWGVDSWTEP